MFEVSREIIKNSFVNYFMNGRYFVLLCISILFLFIDENKKENKNFLVYYSILIFIIIINPICAVLLLKIMSETIYYRMFWLMPIGIIIAYLGTKLVFKLDGKIQKIFVGILFVGIIMYSGRFVYTSSVFEKVNNSYQIPDKYVQVALKLSKISIENKKAMVPVEMVGYVRQIDASTKLAYERRPYEDYKRYDIYNYYVIGDIRNLASVCGDENVNIIVYDKNMKFSEPLENYGFNCYYETEDYNIYVLN